MRRLLTHFAAAFAISSAPLAHAASTAPARVFLEEMSSPELQDACSIHTRIPMAKGPESLNVAAAAALMMYEIRRPVLR